MSNRRSSTQPNTYSHRQSRGAAIAIARTAIWLVGACAAPNPKPVLIRDTTADEPSETLRVPRRTLAPRPSDQGSTSESVLVLRPSDVCDAAERVVRRFFAAVASEDQNALVGLLEPGAPHLRTPGGERRAAEELFRLRFAAHDYRVLPDPGTLPDRLECFDHETLELVGPSRGLSGTVAKNETLVRVRVRPDVPSTLFARELIFVLRSRGGSLAIAEVIEDYELR